MSSSDHLQVYRYQFDKWDRIEAEPIQEAPVSLTVNGKLWLTLMCTPKYLEALAVGFLYNEEVIQDSAEIANVCLCEHGDNVDVWLTHAAERPTHWKRTSGCTGGVTAQDLTSQHPFPAHVGTNGGVSLSPDQVTSLVDKLLKAQEIYKETGGVHTSALSDGIKIVVSAEDIGRHNTLDKIAGLCVMKNDWPEQRILLTTGRISSEMMQKSARMGAEVVISRTAPSALSVKMAESYGITLIGYARQRRFTVYSSPQRILSA